MTRRTPIAASLAALAVVALAGGACGESADRISAAANRVAPAVTPTPRPSGPTPTPAPLTANQLVLAGDVQFEDADPEVVLTMSPTGERFQVEIRHREPGSAAPDSTLVFQEVPPEAGTYTLHAPTTPPTPGRVTAFVTSRTERVGTMKDFTGSVRGTLTLVEESPGVLLGTFQLAAQQAPPPPPVMLPGAPTPAPSVGMRPTPPPAIVQANGSFLALLSSARAPAPAPPPLPTPALETTVAPTPAPVPVSPE